MAKTNETAWAVVAKTTGGVLMGSYQGQKAIYTRKVDAVNDCPSYGKVIKVRITEVKTK